MDRPEPLWITETEHLQRLDELLEGCSTLALDTESNSMFVYQERICLIQLNIDGALILIDPLQIPNEAISASRLSGVLADPAVSVYLHGGEYDVVCLDRDYGLRVKGVLDTQQAASMLGLKSTGYGAMVEECCGVKLPKSHSQYNWGQRPIDDEAIDYALDDVYYLPRVASDLIARVKDADLEEEWAIANQAVEDVTSRPTDYDPQGIFRLKGLRTVPQKKLPVVVALHKWRDDIARELDQPPGRVINNEALVALGRMGAANFGAIKRTGIRGAILREFGEELAEVIRSALTDPPAVPAPPARREVDPLENKREKKLKDWRRKEAERREVPLQAVLPARALEYIKKHGADDLSAIPQFGEKRSRLYADQLRQLLKKFTRT